MSLRDGSEESASARRDGEKGGRWGEGRDRVKICERQDPPERERGRGGGGSTGESRERGREMGCGSTFLASGAKVGRRKGEKWIGKVQYLPPG